MKRLFIAMLMVVMCFSFAGCGDSTSTEETTQPETTEATEETQPAP